MMMKISRVSVMKVLSVKMSIGYWLRKFDMVVFIKNGYCMWFGFWLVGWMVVVVVVVLFVVCGGVLMWIFVLKLLIGVVIVLG